MTRRDMPEQPSPAPAPSNKPGSLIEKITGAPAVTKAVTAFTVAEDNNVSVLQKVLENLAHARTTVADVIGAVAQQRKDVASIKADLATLRDSVKTTLETMSKALTDSLAEIEGRMIECDKSSESLAAIEKQLASIDI